jgi:DNA replication protein DnaC
MRRSAAQSLSEPACPLGICDGTGLIVGPEETARPCECRAPRLAKNKVRGMTSVLPRRFRGVSFDRPPVSDMMRDFQTKNVVVETQRYVDNLEQNLADGRGAWFYGPAGTGKTTLAMLISKTALERGHTVAIYSLPKLLIRIRQTYEASAGEDTYHQLFERLASVDLLHIDDLGAEKTSDWVLEQLYSIVNERYEAERSILVTTNLDEAELKDQVGIRTVSRLVEMCADCMVPLEGEDKRETVHRSMSG